MTPNNRMELTASRCASQRHRCSFSPVAVPAAAHPERWAAMLWLYQIGFVCSLCAYRSVSTPRQAHGLTA